MWMWIKAPNLNVDVADDSLIGLKTNHLGIGAECKRYKLLLK
jgi:hypothetical protein